MTQWELFAATFWTIWAVMGVWQAFVDTRFISVLSATIGIMVASVWWFIVWSEPDESPPEVSNP